MVTWADVGGYESLPEGRPGRVEVGATSVLLVRIGERVLAIGNQCTHQGAGLDRGVLKISGTVKTVTCPAHGSMFDLETGKVMRPPASKPVPVYDVKIEGGRVYVRPRVDI